MLKKHSFAQDVRQYGAHLSLAGPGGCVELGKRAALVTLSKLTPRPISGEEEHFLLEVCPFLIRSQITSSIAAYQSDIRLFAENKPGLGSKRRLNSTKR
jgi:hypothetical protein